MSDKHVEAVIERHRQRAARGMEKYGVTTKRTDLSPLDWLQHAQEEAMDFAVYLETLREQIVAQQQQIDRTHEQRSQDFARRVPVEQRLLDAASGKKPLPTADECRELALRLGKPHHQRPLAESAAAGKGNKNASMD